MIIVGVNDSNDLATAGGTAAGIVIFNPFTCVKRYTSTPINAEIIPINIPAEPKCSAGITYPDGNCCKNAFNSAFLVARAAIESVTSGIDAGTTVSRNVSSAMIAPLKPSKSYDLAKE
ncbi:unknown [Catenibacterium sp. CAG:290]|nr:unknown [Catenibacterium sp. CAG:290]